MITIQNIIKILYKQLGKKNFYVARVEDNIIHNPITNSNQYQYVFELSNRKYAVTIILDRDELNTDTYKLMSSSGNVVYITKKDSKKCRYLNFFDSRKCIYE